MSNFLELVVAGFIGALFALFAPYMERHWRNKDKGRRLAENLSASLDVFAIECAAQIAEDRSAKSSNKAATNIPEFPTTITDADLSLLRGHVAADILELKGSLKLSQSLYKFYFSELSDSVAASDFADLECGKLGMSALEISKRIRKEHKLKHPNYKTGSWDFVGVLSKEKQRHEAREKKNSAASEERE